MMAQLLVFILFRHQEQYFRGELTFQLKPGWIIKRQKPSYIKVLPNCRFQPKSPGLVKL